MLIKIYTYDSFLDISCSCLDVDDHFVNFQRKCLKERKFKDIFVIRNLTERRYSQFYPTEFVVCCKAFVDFQIDLFVKISCNYKLLENDEFASDFNHDVIINCDSADDDDMNAADCFEPSVFFSRKGYNLSFGRFCLRCRQVFLRYFI